MYPKVHAVAIAKLYINHGNQEWENTQLSGPVALSTHTDEKTHFIHLFTLSDRSIALSQELYVDFWYEPSKPFFHSFEMDDCVAGILSLSSLSLTSRFPGCSLSFEMGQW
jgi:hypothetical protein